MIAKYVLSKSLLLTAICVALGLLVTPAAAVPFVELLADPGFEDTRPLEPEDPNTSDPWRKTFFTANPAITNDLTMPNNGLEHATLTKDHANPGADPQIDTAAFAGFGGAPSAFEGKTIQLSVDYKVTANTVLGNPGDPNTAGTFVRMFVSYFGAGGFLGFGDFTNADVFETGTNPDYVNHSFTEVVPTFGQPVTVIAYNLGVLGQFGGTGAATVSFDDASLMVIPEPASTALLGIGISTLLVQRRRSLSKL